jgi:hypothetical protein
MRIANMQMSTLRWSQKKVAAPPAAPVPEHAVTQKRGKWGLPKAPAAVSPFGAVAFNHAGAVRVGTVDPGAQFFKVKEIKKAALAIEQLVGVEPIKVFARTWLKDAVRRRISSEALPTRTILISGPTAIGKKDAADRLAALFISCGIAAGA